MTLKLKKQTFFPEILKKLELWNLYLMIYRICNNSTVNLTNSSAPGKKLSWIGRRLTFFFALIVLFSLHSPVIHADDAQTVIRIAQPGQTEADIIPEEDFQELNRLSIRLLTHLAQLSNFSVKTVPTSTVTEALDEMRANRIDVLPVIDKSENIYSKGIILPKSTLFILSSSIYISSDSGIGFLKEFSGQNIATALTGISLQNLRDYLKNNGIKAKVVQTKNLSEGIELLNSGKVAGLAATDYFVEPFLQPSMNLQNPVIINSGYTFQQIPLTVAVSEYFVNKNPGFFAVINNSIRRFSAQRRQTEKTIFSQISAAEGVSDHPSHLSIIIIAIILSSAILVYFIFIRRSSHIILQKYSRNYRLLKETQEKLNESRRIINTVISATYEVDMKTGRFTGNDNFFLILVGEIRDYIPYHEVIEHMFTEDFTELFGHGREEDIHNGMLELKPITGRVYDAEGSLRYITIYSRSYFDSKGELEYRTGVIIDVTQHKLNELALQNANHELENIQKIAKIAFWKINSNEIEYINTSKEFNHIVGLKSSANNRIHRSMLELIFDKENYNKIQQLYYEFETEGTVSFDLILPIVTMDTAEKKYIHLYTCDSIEEQNSSSENSIVSGIIQDITERYKEQIRIENSNKMKALGRLAGRVAQEFNNQLYGIMGFSEMLQKENLSNVAREYIKYIITSTEQASELIAKLLHFSQNYSQQFEKINIDEILEIVISSLRQTSTPGIKWRKYISSPDITVLADYSELKASLTGLGINAQNAIRKNNTSGGEIIFSTSFMEITENLTDELNIELKPGNYAVISVTDNGCGMTENQQHEVLEPFYSNKEDMYTSGNDLATINEIVSSLNGAFKIKSTPEQGTGIYIYLPATLEESGSSKISSSDNLKNILTNLNILVIDMDNSILRQFKIIFEHLGLNFRLINNSKKAVKDFLNKNSKYDIIFVDMFMPDIDGVELYKKILEIQPESRIIIMNGYYDSEFSQHALKAGVTEFIQKPITQGVLFKKIIEILNYED